MIRVVVAEDHALVRQGISMLLQAAGGFQLVAETAKGSDVELLVQFHKPDLLLLDLALSDSSGIEVARRVRRVAPAVRILVVTGNVYPGSVANAFSAGANGFVLKHEQGSELLDAIQTVMTGRQYVSAQVARGLDSSASKRPTPPDCRRRSRGASSRSCGSSRAAAPTRKSPTACTSACSPRASTGRT